MRISDWSSDVCSSDLGARLLRRQEISESSRARPRDDSQFVARASPFYVKAVLTGSRAAEQQELDAGEDSPEGAELLDLRAGGERNLHRPAVRPGPAQLGDLLPGRVRRRDDRKDVW